MYFLFSICFLSLPLPLPLLSPSLSPPSPPPILLPFLQYQMKSFMKVPAFTKTILKNVYLATPTAVHTKSLAIKPSPPSPHLSYPLHILQPSPHPSTPSDTPTLPTLSPPSPPSPHVQTPYPPLPLPSLSTLSTCSETPTVTGTLYSAYNFKTCLHTIHTVCITNVSRGFSLEKSGYKI